MKNILFLTSTVLLLLSCSSSTNTKASTLKGHPCTKIYLPVCATVGQVQKTYANHCMMRNNSQAVFLHRGACQ